MISKANKNKIRQKRHKRLRNQISGTNEIPRLNVYRSLSNIYAQIIDDVKGVTMVSANSVEKEIEAQVSGKTKVETAAIVGEIIGKRAIEAGIKQVVFDRGGYVYMGRVQAVADGARKAGLEF